MVEELPPPTSSSPSKILPLRERLFLFLTDHNYSTLARLYHYYLDALVALSMVSLFLVTVPSLSDQSWEERMWYALESFIAINFVVDILLKVFCAQPASRYLKTWTALTDSLSVIPWIAESVVWAISKDESGGVKGHLSLEKLNVLRLLRILRFGRFYSAISSAFPDMHLFSQAIKQSRLAIVFLLLFILFSCIFFSSLLFYAETDKCTYNNATKKWLLPGSDKLCTFQNMFDASWFVMVTITTVGYGDVQLNTTFGKVITVIMMLCAVIGMSLPVAIFGANLTELYLERRLSKKAKGVDESRTSSPLVRTDNVNDRILEELSAIRYRLEKFELENK